MKNLDLKDLRLELVTACTLIEKLEDLKDDIKSRMSIDQYSQDMTTVEAIADAALRLMYERINTAIGYALNDASLHASLYMHALDEATGREVKSQAPKEKQ